MVFVGIAVYNAGGEREGVGGVRKGGERGQGRGLVLKACHVFGSGWVWRGEKEEEGGGKFHTS